MIALYELTDELATLSAFIRDLEENNDYCSPIKDVIHEPLVKRMKYIIEMIGK